MFEHIYELLRSPIYDMHIMEKPQLDWLIEFQPTIRKIWIRGDVNTPFETLDPIFKRLKVTDRFRLQSVEADMKTKVTEPLPYRSITIDHSYWLSLPAILNGNNFIILLDRSELTPKEINTILKEWQMGNKLRNLKYLKIRTSKLKDLDSYTNEVLKDLNSTESDGNDGRPSAV
ncbi:hypothetical protein B9Z55_012327 [Caenorhabditis nigoni]|uniref:Sdz-33 F-box domain-containing protein n=1 Tax=Caenorhabditis nigoni TaxID=1611254 RepID=A0A2G5TWP8_9PELO|nr:hypothetical protein B9Z55_012327 [Caenorhabditis nigoni]